MAKEKKSGGGKLKKAEKERQIEEDRIKSIEEAKQAEIRAVKEKLAREQHERDVLEELYKKELTRLDEEDAEMKTINDEKKSELTILFDKANQISEWDRHLQCKSLPNLAIESEINTYLSCWRDTEIVKQDEPSTATLVEYLPEIEELSKMMEEAVASYYDKQENGHASRIIQHQIKLAEIMNDKWDILTASIIQYMDLFSREPNENFQLTASSNQYYYGIWGNITKNPRFKTIEFLDIGMTASLPKPLALSNVAIRMIYNASSAGTIIYDETQQNNLHLSCVGGVLLLDLLELPESPKVVESWNIRQILSPDFKLKKPEYPFKKPVRDTADEEKDESPDFVWRSQIVYQIPAHSFINTKTAQVMYFNDLTKCWENDNISEVDMDVETGKVKFKTTQFKPTAILQSTFCELPYKDWSIVPIGKNKSLLNIQGQFNDITIEIGAGYCRLIKPANPNFMEDGEPLNFSPTLLFKKMSFYGLNFRGPNLFKDIHLKDFILKNPNAEENCVQAISLCSQGFIFRRSPNNTLISSSKCAFKFKAFSTAEAEAMLRDVEKIAPAEEIENAVPESEEVAAVTVTPPAPQENTWKTVLFDFNFKVNSSEFKSGFVAKDNEITDKTRFDYENKAPKSIHSNVYHLLKEEIHENRENGERIDESDVLYTRCMYQMLKATRIVCFA